MLSGVFSTLLVPETMGKSLEVLSNEPQNGFMQGKDFQPLLLLL
jgi:PHS family inorganic phosphate transporter-like MFS transporter